MQAPVKESRCCVPLLQCLKGDLCKPGISGTTAQLKDLGNWNEKRIVSDQYMQGVRQRDASRSKQYYLCFEILWWLNPDSHWFA